MRFLEGKFSTEVLDFNLWLSPHSTSGPPPLFLRALAARHLHHGPFLHDADGSSSAGNPTNFVNFGYAGDPAAQTLDRTKEGYVEIIEMGNVTGGTLTAITHAQPSPPGKPPGCGGLPTGATAPTDLVLGNGGLFGGISLINPLAGGDVTADAVALSPSRRRPSGPPRAAFSRTWLRSTR